MDETSTIKSDQSWIKPNQKTTKANSGNGKTQKTMATSAKLEVQKEIADRLEQDHRRRHMLSVRGNRSCSEQGPHPGHHLWGTRRSRKRTSAPQMGASSGGMRTALILRSRRSWPVAPVASTRYDLWGSIYFAEYTWWYR